MNKYKEKKKTTTHGKQIEIIRAGEEKK